MRTKRRREGELTIDHRFSPGLPPDFYHRIGMPGAEYGLAAPSGSVAEAPTMTCSHCNAIVILNPARTRPRGYCRKCDDYVCDSPACSHDCQPFSAHLDALEAAAYRSGQAVMLGTTSLLLPVKGP